MDEAVVAEASTSAFQYKMDAMRMQRKPIENLRPVSEGPSHRLYV